MRVDNNSNNWKSFIKDYYYWEHNIYRPPSLCNESIKNSIDEFSTTLSTLESSSNLINTGDFNLLKINENRIYNYFFYTIISYSLYPNITFLTRFTRTNGTSIYTFFCKLNKFVLDSAAGILPFSDHLPFRGYQLKN